MRSELEELRGLLAGQKSALTFAEGRRSAVVDELSAVSSELAEAEAEGARAREAVILAESVSESARSEVRTAFEEIVGGALRSVLGDGYGLRIDQSTKRNAAHADFRVECPDYGGGDPMDTRGGGVVDVVSVAARIVVLELLRPAVGGPVLLDEPFKHLSQDGAEAAAAVLNELAARFGRQYLVVTHSRTFGRLAGKVIELER